MNSIPIDTKPKHLQQGQAAILVDAMGADVMTNMFLCHIKDDNEFSMIASTILLIDQEKWIRHFPIHGNTAPDKYSMHITPEEGINITFERHIMTMDGFVPSRNINEYYSKKLQEQFIKLSNDGMLFVAKK